MTMLFVITAIDKPDALSLRVATRQAHLDYVSDTDTLKLGGPFLDANGDMAGSLLIIDAPDMDAARWWHANDPYAKAGLFANSDIRAWKATANRCGAGL
jgi:uncharacterized protein YciI